MITCNFKRPARKINFNEFHVSEIIGNVIRNLEGYRRSVIKWVGKDLTSDIIPKSNDCVPSTLGEQAMSAQEHKQNKQFE